MKHLLIFASLLIGLLILTACAAATIEPVAPTAEPSDTPPPPTSTSTATTTPTPTIAPSPTPTPSLTPTPTNTYGPLLTPTDILPTPAFEDSPIFDDYLFNSDVDPNCTLPCWQGLRIGESGRDDIQAMFDEVFKFNNTLDFFQDNPLKDVDLGFKSLEDVPGYYVTGYMWQWPVNAEQVPGDLEIVLWLDQDTHTLEAVNLDSQFNWENAFRLSPYVVMSQLGTPSYILVSDPQIERTVKAAGYSGRSRIRLMIIYNTGITFRYSGGVLVTIHEENGQHYGKLCFEQGGGWSQVSITRPITDELNALPPLQQMLVGRWIDELAWQLVPFEEIFDATLEEATELALQGECVRTPLQ